ncbi:hypothetical protein BDV30DRAFT_198362 [Aspergillus minisclerotigenes]|uniref:Uncharacterized protein n=1 Tax=Aspergillus minisclerotigenes TaxID=656917 RepID=A0A5N6IUJ8_9EURO|nr:hypothetical protein BDV30DRAFT_198362 [Aspergillus minisclerotigenes]
MSVLGVVTHSSRCQLTMQPRVSSAINSDQTALLHSQGNRTKKKHHLSPIEVKPATHLVPARRLLPLDARLTRLPNHNLLRIFPLQQLTDHKEHCSHCFFNSIDNPASNMVSGVRNYVPKFCHTALGQCFQDSSFAWIPLDSYESYRLISKRLLASYHPRQVHHDSLILHFSAKLDST